MLGSIFATARTQIVGAMPRLPTSVASTSSIMQSIFVRGYKQKTHQGAAKRWRKMANGQFKRKQCGRLHGNVGWSKARILNHLNGTVTAKGNRKGNQKKKLERMLPHH